MTRPEITLWSSATLSYVVPGGARPDAHNSERARVQYAAVKRRVKMLMARAAATSAGNGETLNRMPSAYKSTWKGAETC